MQKIIIAFYLSHQKEIFSTKGNDNTEVQQFQQMQSQSPCILRHFIPFEFSRQAVDLPTSALPKQPFVPKEDNPLQNMKLRALAKTSDPQFTLTFTNLTHQKYKPKHRVRIQKLLQQVHNQKESTADMYRQTQRQRTVSTGKSGRGKNEIAQSQCQKQKGRTSLHHRNRTQDSKNIRRSKTEKKMPEMGYCELLPDSPEHQMYGCHLRNLRTSSTGRLCRTSHPFPKDKEKPLQEERKLNVKGSLAPSSEVVDYLKRTTAKGLKIFWS